MEVGAAAAAAKARAGAEAPGTPVISVIVCSYNSRRRIDTALRSLQAQDLEEPYEVIVVDSGTDGAADHVAAEYPWVRVCRSELRLRPGPARNVGVRAARGAYVAFLPDDGVARPDWLRRRVAKHREGYEAVGGAITNGTRFHPIGSAGYYLEYSALIPSERILTEQRIPHCLSYGRELFDRLGPFPEDTETGEDTIFNERCVAAGTTIGFASDVQLAHRNPKRLRAYLSHQYEHGRGLVQCVERYGFASTTGPAEQPVPLALYRMFVRYPARRWWNALQRIRRGRRAWLLGYVLVSPLVWAGLWATAAGAWSEWRALRRGST